MKKISGSVIVLIAALMFTIEANGFEENAMGKTAAGDERKCAIKFVQGSESSNMIKKKSVENGMEVHVYEEDDEEDDDIFKSFSIKGKVCE